MPSTDIKVPMFINTFPTVAYRINLLTGLRNLSDHRKVKTTKAQPRRETDDATLSVMKRSDSCSFVKPVIVEAAMMIKVCAVQARTGQL